MYHFFVPTKQNKYKAHLLRTPALFVFMLAILIFNFSVGPTPVAAVNADISAEEIINLHNIERKKLGLAPLVINSALTTSAQRKAQAMLNSDCWSHYCPNGKSPWDFFDAAGYEYTIAGENLAEGFFDNEDVMVAWMNSPTHKANIVKAEFEEVGVGIVSGFFQNKPNNIVIAVHFGTPQSDDSKSTNSAGQQGELPTPAITSPENGVSINSRDFTVQGTAPEASQVQLFDNSKEWVTADANQGIFTYKATNVEEGEHVLTARSQIGVRESALSDESRINVDVTPDQLLIEQIVVVGNGNGSIDINIASSDLSSLSLISGTDVYEFAQTEEMIWEASIPVAAFTAASEFDVSNTDAAGNRWTGSFKSSDILSQITQLEFVSSDGEQPSPTRYIKSQVNLAALVILLILFAIDFVALTRTGMTKGGGFSHLHFGVLLIVGIIVATGTFGGEIGVGLTF